jgi:hypothetical protein
MEAWWRLRLFAALRAVSSERSMIPSECNYYGRAIIQVQGGVELIGTTK